MRFTFDLTTAEAQALRTLLAGATGDLATVRHQLEAQTVVSISLPTATWKNVIETLDFAARNSTGPHTMDYRQRLADTLSEALRAGLE